LERGPLQTLRPRDALYSYELDSRCPPGVRLPPCSVWPPRSATDEGELATPRSPGSGSGARPTGAGSRATTVQGGVVLSRESPASTQASLFKGKFNAEKTLLRLY